MLPSAAVHRKARSLMGPAIAAFVTLLAFRAFADESLGEQKVRIRLMAG